MMNQDQLTELMKKVKEGTIAPEEKLVLLQHVNASLKKANASLRETRQIIETRRGI